MNWYLIRLVPPRPDFGSTMSADEQQAMMRHVAYWRGHLEAGRALIFSPVADPARRLGHGRPTRRIHRRDRRYRG